MLPNVEGCPYVRLQSAGKGSGTSAWRVLKEAMGHGVRWHDWRHLFAVRCLQRGVPMAYVSQWMGHSDVNLTVKRYGRFAAEAKEQWTWINALGHHVEDVAQGRRIPIGHGDVIAFDEHLFHSSAGGKSRRQWRVVMR